jgi:hypothetical protein
VDVEAGAEDADEEEEIDEQPTTNDLGFLDDGDVSEVEGLHAALSERLAKGKARRAKKNKTFPNKAGDDTSSSSELEPTPTKKGKRKLAKISGEKPSVNKIACKRKAPDGEEVNEEDQKDVKAKKARGGGHKKLRVGDPELPEGWWSLTLGTPNADLPLSWVTKYDRWLHAQNEFEEDYCEEGVGSTEMGDKRFLLHLQAMFKSRMLATDTGIKRMKETFNAFTGRCPAQDGTKMTLKPFAMGQEVREMGGYVFKDQNMPHFQYVCKGDF